MSLGGNELNSRPVKPYITLADSDRRIAKNPPSTAPGAFIVTNVAFMNKNGGAITPPYNCIYSSVSVSVTGGIIVKPS